jgi:hypothetical protein
MFAKVIRDQFERRDESIIHTPTGAEFTPVLGVEGSVIVWTGNIGRRLPDGLVYHYEEVLGMVKELRQDFAIAA